MGVPLTLSLSEAASAGASLAGGKGAMLGDVLRRGHRVPAGFVVTTAAYELALDPLRSHELRPDADPSPERLRELLSTAPVPPTVDHAIRAAYAALGSVPVAVRSSSTTEDLAGGAFAGQHDTYLNVIGPDAVVDAVRRCWASLWTDRATSYRERRGIGSADARIAVVVQRMVDATAAGVLFTANPVTGARDELVVDASAGLGEAVVSGDVTPDHYRLRPDGHVLEARPGNREVVIRAAPGGGVIREAAADRVTGGQAADPAADHAAEGLPPTVLVELSRLGRTLASELGRPQDIEWALDDEGTWLLQARPLTALPPPPAALSRLQRRIGPQLLEMLPIRPYPLDLTAWTGPGLGRMVERMLGEMVGVRIDFAETLPEVDGIVECFVPPQPRATLGTPRALLRDVGRVRRHRAGTWTADARFADFERRVTALSEQDLRTRTWEELLGGVDEALASLHLVTDLRVDYLPHAAVSLVRLRVALGVLRRVDLFVPLITGASTRTRDANRALEQLADLVRSDEVLRAGFAARDGQALLQRLGEPEWGRFRDRLDVFLREFGHRETTSVLLISEPTWSDSPRTAIEAVMALLDEPAGRPDPGEAAMAQLLSHPALRRFDGLRRGMTRLAETAQAGIALREDTHFHAGRSLAVVRRIALELGRRLAAAGAISRGDDVFHLRLDELRPLASGMAGPASQTSVREAVRRRAGRRAELAGAPLISPLSLRPAEAGRPRRPGRPGDPAVLVTGSAGGGGRATGPVRLIADPSEFGRLRAGEVLVCPYTNPAWTILFRRASAIVVDTGGVGSHAAIVAREYGIPAVLATCDGTSRVTDGQRIVVDGDRGVVTAADASGPGYR